MGLSRPHAIAFSGLGSKYIQLCFRHIMDIEILFDRIMHVVQRDNYVPGDTKVLFNDNPSQVISQGLNIDRMSVNETFDIFYGLDESINESVLHYGDVMGMNVRDCMSRSFQIFLDVLRSNEISDILACYLNINLNLVLNDIDTLVNMGEKSMDLCLNEYLQVTQPSNRCDKALFFWSLKHSLYEWLKANC